ncbi:MAG: family transcriptional regulator [Bacilli bacterium]|nr:family transcriptional regulator [Bacilli bacterium]
MFQFTLRAARINCGHTLEEVATACGVTVRKIKQYEKDSGRMPRNIAAQIVQLYRISCDYIFIGKEKDCAQYAILTFFSDDDYNQFVKRGRIESSFQFFHQLLEDYNDFEEGTSEEEIRNIKAFVFDNFKLQLAIAIKNHIVCCGQPVQVQAGYNLENGEHTIRVDCTCCDHCEQIKTLPTVKVTQASRQGVC